MKTNEERRKAAEWFRNRAKNCPMPGARRMYEIATEALEERERNEQPHWIPVLERLPEVGEWVLCYCRANIYEVLKMRTSGDWVHDVHHIYMHSFVTHWMPLPESPDHIGESTEMVEKESES